LFMLIGWCFDSAAAAAIIGTALLVSVLIGTVLVPIALPWLPGASFALKGTFLGLLWNSLFLFGQGDQLSLTAKLATLLFCTTFGSFYALNFTGCTPFTSLSGVREEMNFAIPGFLAALFCSALLAGWAIFS